MEYETPIPLIQWSVDNEPKGTMAGAGGYWHQILFVRDSLQYLLGRGLSYYQGKERISATVIATHRSKSVELPVYCLTRKATPEDPTELQLILRDNFYNWKLSVISNKKIDVDLTGLCGTKPPTEPEYHGNDLAPVYFEGFPKHLIFGWYETSDKKQWSAQIGGESPLWTVIFLIVKALGYVRPYIPLGEEAHRKQLDAEAIEAKEYRKRHLQDPDRIRVEPKEKQYQ